MTLCPLPTFAIALCLRQKIHHQVEHTIHPFGAETEWMSFVFVEMCQRVNPHRPIPNNQMENVPICENAIETSSSHRPICDEPKAFKQNRPFLLQTLFTSVHALTIESREDVRVQRVRANWMFWLFNCMSSMIAVPGHSESFQKFSSQITGEFPGNYANSSFTFTLVFDF